MADDMTTAQALRVAADYLDTTGLIGGVQGFMRREADDLEQPKLRGDFGPAQCASCGHMHLDIPGGPPRCFCGGRLIPSILLSSEASSSVHRSGD